MSGAGGAEVAGFGPTRKQPHALPFGFEQHPIQDPAIDQGQDHTALGGNGQAVGDSPDGQQDLPHLSAGDAAQDGEFTFHGVNLGQ